MLTRLRSHPCGQVSILPAKPLSPIVVHRCAVEGHGAEAFARYARVHEEVKIVRTL